MRFAINLPNFGPYADPRLVADLARETEESGWDGFFVWDHLLWSIPDAIPMADPYILLAAAAMSTNRIKFGPLITPVPRRRPWKLARETVTLDHLSGGRLIFGAGIGGDWFGDYSTFGEPADQKVHGELLDEGLDVLAGLWSGEPFSYEGKHFHVRDAVMLPKPVQQPRIPVWVAAMLPVVSRKPLRRAARWDGISFANREMDRSSPDEIKAVLAEVRQLRGSYAPFDVTYWGETSGTDRSQDTDAVAPYAEAGVTWWMEDISPLRGTLDEVRERIRLGPPQLR